MEKSPEVELLEKDLILTLYDFFSFGLVGHWLCICKLVM